MPVYEALPTAPAFNVGYEVDLPGGSIEAKLTGQVSAWKNSRNKKLKERSNRMYIH